MLQRLQIFWLLQMLQPTYLALPEPTDHTHDLWTNGSNKKLLRVLLKVGQVVEIFRNVSYHHYVNNLGIGTALENLDHQMAYHLKGGIPYAVQLGNVRSGIVAMKCIETGLDYHRVMQRLQFQPVAAPPRASKQLTAQAHEEQVVQQCSDWAEYLLMEKRRQMKIENAYLRPTLPRQWTAASVWSMPVVIWISIEKGKQISF